jgi:hypothetical protein
MPGPGSRWPASRSRAGGGVAADPDDGIPLTTASHLEKYAVRGSQFGVLALAATGIKTSSLTLGKEPVMRRRLAVVPGAAAPATSLTARRPRAPLRPSAPEPRSRPEAPAPSS